MQKHRPHLCRWLCVLPELTRTERFLMDDVSSESADPCNFSPLTSSSYTRSSFFCFHLQTASQKRFEVKVKARLHVLHEGVPLGYSPALPCLRHAWHSIFRRFYSNQETQITFFLMLWRGCKQRGQNRSSSLFNPPPWHEILMWLKLKAHHS